MPPTPGPTLNSEQPSTYAGPVTVDIQGITQPTTFTQLGTALGALLESLRAMPLSDADLRSFGDFLAPDQIETIAEQLHRTGLVTRIAFLGFEAHLVRIRPVSTRPVDGIDRS
ncbi:hypothetical protein [Kitasatospora sp. NPDC050543]|uniref:hypothetical protein n=1 Tax=Kitasatospora sp. NPDC050543 TaxID=3364054 RepID=UPI0037A3BA42